MRRATRAAKGYCTQLQYFYPRSPCGERPTISNDLDSTKQISIHALLAESDAVMPGILCASVQFLSTLSLRRATRKRHYNGLSKKISIHALLAESDMVFPRSFLFLIDFYPRSPCGERPAAEYGVPIIDGFLSTLSLRRATLQQRLRLLKFLIISIHALLAESD